MREIRDMSILEIDITNACMNSCSNCTRFCGHHSKPYFMDFETFKKAIDSLNGFEGLISIMGGEPLLHPEFERFISYLEEKRSTKALQNTKAKAIVKDYLSYAQAQRWFNNSYNKGAGYNVFTSIPSQFYKHYEIIQDTFTHMFLNDHSNPSFHQPILISRKDLGISDEEFKTMRENCWLQNFWSASITPKGAFFCEIAGTLDMLLDGPGGKKIEPGWWKYDIKDFKEQFHYCDLCGMALKTFSRNANDGIDDASRTLYEKLKELNTPRFKQNKVSLYDHNEQKNKDGENFSEDMMSATGNYEPDYEKRLGTAASNLRPKKIIGIIKILNEEDRLAFDNLYEKFKNKVDYFYIVASEEYENNGITLNNADKLILLKSYEYQFGLMLNKVMKIAGQYDWLILLNNSGDLPEKFSEMICQMYLNPGYLFECNFSQNKIYLFNKIAGSLKKAGFSGVKYCNNETDFANLWGKKKYKLEIGFEKTRDINIDLYRNEIYDNYINDNDFIERLKIKLNSEAVKKKDTILLTHSAFIFHTTSIGKILEREGYNIKIISSKKFKEYFENWFDINDVYYFEDNLFNFKNIKPLLDDIKKKNEFIGSIIPFFPGASTVKEIDAYTEVFKSAEYVAGKIIGIINIRRNFVDIEYNY